MSDIEGLNHSGLSLPDVRQADWFYHDVLGARTANVIGGNGDEIRKGRGAPHPCYVIGDYAFVVFVSPTEAELTPEKRGIDGSRHGFAVSRDRFDEIVARARSFGIEFEGPRKHPEAGPLGESIYFTDPGGSFFEVCWRRDEGQGYDPVYVDLNAPPVPLSAAGPGVNVDGIAGVMLEVADLRATRAFYDPIFADAGGEWREDPDRLTYMTGSQRVEFVLREAPRNWAHAGEHQAYRVRPDRVAVLVEQLQAAGHTVNWWREDAPDERESSPYVDDPSGNRVQLIAAAETDSPFIDHLAIIVHEIEEAEALYIRAMGRPVAYYHGARAGDLLQAKAEGEAAGFAPWTRRSSMSFRTHRMEAVPAVQFFLDFDGTTLAVFLTSERIPELPEGITDGTPRVIFRSSEDAETAFTEAATADVSPVPMNFPRHLPLQRIGRTVFARDGSGNFLQIDCK